MIGLSWALCLIWGYLWGSMSSAIIVCRYMNLPDPRTHGSQNPGATNVLRIGGKKAALFTLIGDLLKGFIPVLLIRLFFPAMEALWLVAGIGAFIGHMFPIFFKFQGGKGVATAFGVLLAWHMGLAGATLIIWLSVFAFTRISSLSALIAAFSAPWIAFIGIGNIKIAVTVLFMVSILIYRHKANIYRLIHGQESAFNFKKKP